MKILYSSIVMAAHTLFKAITDKIHYSESYAHMADRDVMHLEGFVNSLSVQGGDNIKQPIVPL